MREEDFLLDPLPNKEEMSGRLAKLVPKKREKFHIGYGQGGVICLLAAYSIARETCLVWPLEHALLLPILGLGGTIYLLSVAGRLFLELLR